MEPTNIRFGGGSAETILHPIVAIALVAAVLLILFLPRRHVIVPLLFTTLLVPFGQVVVLGGVHFTVYRILIIFGLIRCVMSAFSSETGGVGGGLNAMDRAFALCALFSALAFVLTWMETQAFVKQVGSLLDALGGYFLLRFLIQSGDDVRRVIKLFAVIAVVVAVCMLNEQITGRNIFMSLGGLASDPAIREGHLRSQGPFEVYITAGVFGATFLPLLLWLRKDPSSKTIAYAGITACSVIALTSHSSTPLLAYAAGIVGLCFWPFREQMRVFLWGLVLTLTSLHLVMKAPVWALIARIDLTGSSSGYHRYMLVDNFIRHFGDWWLLGVKDYDSWGFDMWDLSNQYVQYGVTGGLVTLVLFIAVIWWAFRKLGQARRCVAGDREHEWFLWCIGAALLAHVVSFFGISYFDQMQMAWYALLAIICVAVSEASRPSAVEAQEEPRCQVRDMYWDALETNL